MKWAQFHHVLPFSLGLLCKLPGSSVRISSQEISITLDLDFNARDLGQLWLQGLDSAFKTGCQEQFRAGEVANQEAVLGSTDFQNLQLMPPAQPRVDTSEAGGQTAGAPQPHAPPTSRRMRSPRLTQVYN